MKRIQSIDFARGLVMVIMALDHVRDLIHVDSISKSPTDLTTTTPMLFFTRWITYLCAPTFVFLAGTSAFISSKRKTTQTSRKFLITRGVWLILLEFTLVNFGISFDAGFHLLLFEVIAAIGFSFIILGLILNAPVKAIGIAGLVIIFTHDLFPLIPFGESSIAKQILTPFFQLTAIPISSLRTFVMAYPPIPWLGIMLVGFACGKLFEIDANKRTSLFVKIGAGALLLFIVLRFVNYYGEPVAWTRQKDGMFSFLSFMNVSKYPPSLQFTLITLGSMFLLLALGEQLRGRLVRVAVVYGKVPMFYFIVHFYFVHFIMLIIMFAQGFQWTDLSFASGTFGRSEKVQSGLPLWGVYIIWILVVVILYWPCKWFANYKAKHKDGLLRYF